MGSPKLRRLARICWNFLRLSSTELGRETLSDFLVLVRFKVCGNQFIPLDLLDATDSDWGVEELAKKQWEPSQMNYVPSMSLQNSPFSLIPKNVATYLYLAKSRCQVWVASAGTQRLKPGKSHGEDGSGQAADLKGSEEIGGFSQLLGTRSHSPRGKKHVHL